VFICSKHEKVREVVDHAFDPVFTVDEAGIICTVNESACKTFGYSEPELVGHNVSMVCGGGHAENHDQYMKNYMETGIKKIIGRTREVKGKKKDGSEFPCQLGVQEISDASSGKRYFCGFFKDLTQIKQHEAEKQEMAALQQGMIDCSFDPMFETDEVGIIKIVNNAACNMFGYTRDEFLGSNISMICGDEHAERHASYMERYKKTGQKHIIGRKRQVKARRKDGSEILVELGVQEVILASGKKAFCGYIRDLTEKQKDKRALRKQQQMIHNKFFGETGEDESF
jgi:PAS domain S-box-containing protein